MNQYRCDLGNKETAATVFLIPPNTTSALELGFDQLPNDASIIHYCGPGAPGSMVNISPVEATASATFGKGPSG
jgi:hypothetical protein